jgi:hypothetical protein
MAHLAAARALAAGPLPPAPRRSVGVIMVGSALSFLDSTIVHVALRSLPVTPHASLAQVQWVVASYPRPRRTTRPHRGASHSTANNGGSR